MARLEDSSSILQQIINFLIIGCLPQLVCGGIFVFPVYINALKQFLHLDQHQVELLSGVITLAFCLGLPASLFLRALGSIPTFFVGMLFSFVGFIGAWAVKFMDHEHGYTFPVLVTSFLAIGHGTSYTYIASLVTTCRYFGDEHQGKIIFLLEGILGIAPVVNQQIYFAFFVDGKYANYLHHDVFGFMLFCGVFSAIASGLAVICVFASERLNANILTEENKTDGERQGLINNTETGLLQILKTMNCHLLFWSFVLGRGISLSFEMNISVFTETLLFNDHFHSIFICFHSCVLLSRVLVALLVDALYQSVSCMLYFSIVSTFAGISLVVSSTIHISLTYYYIFALVNGAMLGIDRPAVAVTVRKRIGESLFALVWTSLVFCSCCFSLILQQIIASFYQMKIFDRGKTCYGQPCLDSIFLLFSVGCFLSGLLSAVLTIRKY